MTRRRADIVEILRQRLLSGLHLTKLTHGQRLPSARHLSREMGADPRVILAAYRVLEQEGLVELRPRSGIFLIASDSSAGGPHRRTHDWMVELLLEAVERGIPAPEFPERLRRSLETLRLRVACIECNVDQIDEISHELHTTYGFDVSGVDVYEMLDSARLPKEVRKADLLVTTHFHAHEVQPIAAQLGKPLIVAELLVDGFADVARRLSEGPVYYVVVDPRFAKKLGKIFSSARCSDNLHA
ncbi:MAG TPA: GntR family transcriptional regulator, partial [Gemmatimonadales bacterium]|nr:GntR family transcriptional regulator [Gemmatimonadales bacterium]